VNEHCRPIHTMKTFVLLYDSLLVCRHTYTNIQTYVVWHLYASISTHVVILTISVSIFVKTFLLLAGLFIKQEMIKKPRLTVIQISHLLPSLFYEFLRNKFHSMHNYKYTWHVWMFHIFIKIVCDIYLKQLLFHKRIRS